ncbi:hypothetical protein CPT_Marzo_236 [Stenotrophomonas phage Marzo]|nr:hypothetical protein CPT_Marzo_236 [Stenotrophomonas phage Marzo]
MAALGSHIPVNLTTPIFLGPYSHVPTNLGASVDCLGLWKGLAHNKIDFNFQTFYKPAEFNAVDFTFDCIVPDICDDAWIPDVPGFAVDVDFGTPYTPNVPGFAVDVDWSCRGPRPPVLFDGFITAYQGESGEARLWEPFQATGYEGTWASADLQLFDSAIRTGPAYQGEWAGLDELSVVSGLAPRAYQGESSDATLSTSTTFAFDNYQGEYALGDLTIPARADMAPVAYQGESAEATASVTQTLSPVAYQGEWASTFELQLTEFIRAYTGEYAEASLATDDTFYLDYYTGEEALVELGVRPSEPLGTFRAYQGENAYVEMKVAYAIRLYPEVIKEGPRVVLDWNGIDSIDLTRRSCCPTYEFDYQSIELTDGVPVGTTYTGEAIVCSASLEARPRFSATAFTGETTYFVDPTIFQPVAIRTGERAEVQPTLETFTLDIKLCPGNLIPDPDFANIELVGLYDENCDAQSAYTGETMLAEISSVVGPEPRAYTGEWSTTDLIVDPIMRAFAYEGVYARTINPDIPTGPFQDGATAFFMFAEPDWIANTGEACTLSNLATEYFVEFLENGCLTNDFIPIDENGDPIPELNNPVPVELDQFRHSILARCF